MNKKDENPYSRNDRSLHFSERENYASYQKVIMYYKGKNRGRKSKVRHIRIGRRGQAVMLNRAPRVGFLGRITYKQTLEEVGEIIPLEDCLS